MHENIILIKAETRPGGLESISWRCWSIPGLQWSKWGYFFNCINIFSEEISHYTKTTLPFT